MFRNSHTCEEISKFQNSGNFGSPPPPQKRGLLKCFKPSQTAAIPVPFVRCEPWEFYLPNWCVVGS